MGPLEPKQPSIPQVGKAPEKAKYSLENLPTAIQKIITSFIQPEQAFKGSPASKMVHKILQDNGIWQTVARTLNIKLEDPKHARQDLENLFRSVNKLTLRYLLKEDATSFVSIVDPFAQNKAIEKFLQKNDNKEFTTCEMLEKLIGDLSNKRDLNRVDIETVKMFIKNGALDSQNEILIKKLLELAAGVLQTSEQGNVSYFSHPEIIGLILDRLKEKGIPLEGFFFQPLYQLFKDVPQTLDKRNGDCIAAFLERGMKIQQGLLYDIFDGFILFSSDQWPVIELFFRYGDKDKLKEIKNVKAKLNDYPDFFIERQSPVRRAFEIKKALFHEILSYTTGKKGNDSEAYQEAIDIINKTYRLLMIMADGNPTSENIIKQLSKILPLKKEVIAKIVNSNWDLEQHRKEMRTIYERASEYISKL